MSALRQYGMVRVRRLLKDSDAYDGWKVNKRPPQVGDVGSVVYILSGVDSGPDGYVEESSGPDGVSVWHGFFVAEELEPVEPTEMKS